MILVDHICFVIPWSKFHFKQSVTTFAQYCDHETPVVHIKSVAVCHQINKQISYVLFFTFKLPFYGIAYTPYKRQLVRRHYHSYSSRILTVNSPWENMCLYCWSQPVSVFLIMVHYDKACRLIYSVSCDCNLTCQLQCLFLHLLSGRHVNRTLSSEFYLLDVRVFHSALRL